MSDMRWTIIPLEKRHLHSAVELHLKAFPSFFLSFLGPSFLREFYSSFLNDSVGVGLVAQEAVDGRVVGVVVGSSNSNGYFKRLLRRRWWAFCWASFSAILRRPAILPRLFRALCYRGDTPCGPSRALLSSIAVDPIAQYSGVGKALVSTWVETMRSKKSVRGCYLTTDADGNDAVNRFYGSCGWILESSFVTKDGRKMNRYTLDFGCQHVEKKF
jgi:GNAT superfamily N-acetyltransferase